MHYIGAMVRDPAAFDPLATPVAWLDDGLRLLAKLKQHAPGLPVVVMSAYTDVASTAGGHFNPATQPHGKVDTATHHGGDMNNISADASGVATVNIHAKGVVLGGGAANDAVGRAVIVHADPDDYISQPSGNAGARVACGVITAG